MKNIRVFYLKFSVFWSVKFSIYLNRHAYVMIWFYFSGLSNRIIRINIQSLGTGASLMQIGS